MQDENGFDYGAVTGIGLAIASAVVLLFIFSMFRTSMAADRTIALESAASEVCGDIETVASMAIPYSAERHYGLDGIDVFVSSGYVNASDGERSFSRPFACRIVPGKYSENGTLLWNGTAGMREYLNCTFNVTGTEERPVRNGSPFIELMGRASMSTLSCPVKVPHGKPLLIEKTFIYVANGTTKEAEPYVLVYGG
jgi:hypothetical protein